MNMRANTVLPTVGLDLDEQDLMVLLEGLTAMKHVKQEAFDTCSKYHRGMGFTEYDFGLPKIEELCQRLSKALETLP